MTPSKQSKVKREPATTRTARLSLSNPLEEYCLRLLLHHPELIGMSEGLLPEYFQNSQNREIFRTWQKNNDLTSLRDNLDLALWEHLDKIVSIDAIDNKVEDKLAEVMVRLRGKYLQDLENESAAAFAAAAEQEGADTDVARLQKKGIDAPNQLREVFEQKGRINRSRKGWT
jgi:hypothetical protein